jgi:two-component system response regulator RegA
MNEPTPTRILLVDDDELFTSVLARALTRRGYRVSCATHPKAALQQAGGLQPERAVLDLNLGATSGLQLIPQLLALCPQMRILVLTGYSSIATAVEAIKLGAQNYLCKPAGTDELVAALESNAANPGIAIADNPPSVERMEWEYIQRVLRENGNNISATARSLGMHRRTLQRKLQKRPVKH